MRNPRAVTIYAQNVNIGGAKILLQTLVQRLVSAHPELKVRVLLDEILGRGHALFSLANGIRSCSCPARRK